jgi:DNA-binding SARP family transcriptional activator/tetratricopeptide (TPR) repeat protein
MTHTPRLRTLGDLRLRIGVEEPLRGRRKVLVLLTYLALRSPRAVPRETLAALLWGDREEGKARQSLRQALRELRRVLGGRIEISLDRVALAPGAVDLDVRRIESDLAEGRPERALRRWRGDFLAGSEDVGSEAFRAWLEEVRERLRRRRIDALQRLVADAEERGAWSAVLGWSDQWVAMEPLSEAANTRLVLALRLAGRADEAGRAHAAFVALRRRELGEDPSAEFLDLASGPGIPPPRAIGRSARSAALFSPDMVGRGAGFRRLLEAWETVRGGGAAIRVVEGEEGIGKTRLCEEFLRWLESSREDALVLRARGYAAERELEWVTLRDLLSGLERAPGLGGAPDDALAAVAELAPAVRERFPRLPRQPQRTHTLLDALRRVLGDVAAEVPLVVFVDDVPSADRASQPFLLALARRLPANCLLLATVSTGVPDAGDLVDSLGDCPDSERIPLRGLTPDEVEAMLRSMLELDVEQRRMLARQLHAETAGNPFYVLALVAALADADHLRQEPSGVWTIDPPTGELPLPATIRDLVEARLRHLSAAARAALGAAACQGRSFDPAALEGALPLTPIELRDALEELMGRRLLRLAPGPARRLEFSHDLIRRISLEIMGPSRRPVLHRDSQRASGRSGDDASGAGEPGSGSTPEPLRRATVPRHRLRRAGALVAVILAMVTARSLLPSREASAPLSASTVAVLPFSVRGSPEYGYLAEGMVDLLSANLDGAGDLHSVTPRALLTWLHGTRPDSLDARVGRAVAERFGAGLWILGDIVEAGGRLRITAALHSRTSDGRPLARSSVEGDAVELFRLVDRLTAELLAGRSGGPDGRVTRLALATTESLAALKLYLEGEHAFRSGRFSEAVRSFQHAVAADSQFALAHYRLSIAAEWYGPPDIAHEAAEAAVRHGHRLSSRDRELLEALGAIRKGDAPLAERLYRGILAVYPDDAEAWVQLGEVLFHHGAEQGRTIGESREAWEQVLRLEPGQMIALYHLARIAAIAGDLRELDLLVSRISALAPDHERARSARLMRALRAGDTAGRERLLRELRGVNDESVIVIAFDAVIHGGDATGAERVLDLLVAPDRATHTRAWGHLWKAHVLLGRGRWAAAMAELETLAALDPRAAADHRALFHLLPFAPVTETDLQSTYERVAASAGAEPPRPKLPSTEYDGVHDWIPEYLLGLLASRLGDAEAAYRHAEHLARVPPGGARAARASSMAASVRAGALSRVNDPRALDELDAARLQLWYEARRWSAFYGQALERFLRAELLRRAGRMEEALSWYAALGEGSPFEAPYIAASHLRRAEILDQLGRREEAAFHYARFAQHWNEADDALRPRVVTARERISALQATR